MDFQQADLETSDSRSAAVEVSLNGDTGDDETSSLFGEASKFHKPGEYTVDQDTGHITWFAVLSKNSLENTHTDHVQV